MISVPVIIASIAVLKQLQHLCCCYCCCSFCCSHKSLTGCCTSCCCPNQDCHSPTFSIATLTYVHFLGLPLSCPTSSIATLMSNFQHCHSHVYCHSHVQFPALPLSYPIFRIAIFNHFPALPSSTPLSVLDFYLQFQASNKVIIASGTLIIYSQLTCRYLVQTVRSACTACFSFAFLLFPPSSLIL